MTGLSSPFRLAIGGLRASLLLAFFAAASHAQTVTHWTPAADGVWTDASDWSNGLPQNSTFQAVIDATGANYTVTLSADETVNSVVLNSANATLLISSTNLTLVGGATSSFLVGTVQLAAGEIIGGPASGSVVLDNAATILATSGGAYLSGNGGTNLAFHNTGTVTAAGASLFVGYYAGDSVTNSGLIEANGNGMTSLVYFQGSSTTNTGTIEALTSASGSATVAMGAPVGPSTVSNSGSGLLEANGAGATLHLGYPIAGSTWTNTGTIEALNGGTVILDGTFTSANLTSGTIDGAGGTLDLAGTFTNSGALPSPTTGTYTLAGGTIVGGTVDGSILTLGGAGGGTLDGVAATGNFTVKPNGSFTAENGTILSGGSVAFPSNNDVFLSGTGTALTLASDETWTGTFYLYALAAGESLVNDGVIVLGAGATQIYGGGYAGFSFNNAGTINEPIGVLYAAFSNETLVNEAGGLISADGGSVYLGSSATSGGFTNNGTIEASGSGGTFSLGQSSPGTWTFTNTGTISAANGGTVNVYGNFVNNGGSLALNAGSIVFASAADFSTGSVQGSGSVTASTLTVGHTLAPATGSGPGSLAITGNLTLLGSSVAQFQVGGTAAGTQYDTILVSGSAGLNGTLDLTLVNGFAQNATNAEAFTLLQSSSLSGSFLNAPSGTQLLTTDGHGSFLVSYGAGSAYNADFVVLSNFIPVPEPATWALLLAGLAVLGFSSPRLLRRQSK